MKKTMLIMLAVLLVGFATGATFVHQATQNNKVGFGSVISAESTGSIALSSCDGMTKVDADQACQIGTGTNEDDGTIAYRGNKLALVTVDTAATDTTNTLYDPVMIGEFLIGKTGGVSVVWFSDGLTTNDWVQL